MEGMDMEKIDVDKEKVTSWLEDIGKQVGSDVVRLGKELRALYAEQVAKVTKQTAHLSKQAGREAAHVRKEVGKEASHVSKQMRKQADHVSKQAAQASKQMSKQATQLSKQAALMGKQVSEQAEKAAQQAAKTAEQTALAAQKRVEQTQKSIAKRTRRATKRLPFTLVVLAVFGAIWWLSRKPEHGQGRRSGLTATTGEGVGLQPQDWQGREAARQALEASPTSPAATMRESNATGAATQIDAAQTPPTTGIAHAPSESQLATDEYVPPAVPASTIMDVFGGTPRNVQADTSAEVEATSDLEREHVDEVDETASRTGKRDDLTIIEGIGSKVAPLLKQNGITTFAQLADADVERLRQILRHEGLPMLDPATWPEQARLAMENRYDQLQALKESLKAGRRA
jgi:predicted flap endonuclease-1-like 5' DNA nuclease